MNVCTCWIGSGTEADPFRPQIYDDHPEVRFGETGEYPPYPGDEIIVCLAGEPKKLEAVACDHRYKVED